MPEFSMADSCDPHTCWCTCEVDLCSQDIQNISKDFCIDSALLVGQKKFIRICALDLLNYVLKLLHKDFGDICKDSESLEARGIHDYIHDNLKCLFLLWHSAFRS
ncbi:hypothetical protein Tco_0088404 [Tanacetum coccineum]